MKLYPVVILLILLSSCSPLKKVILDPSLKSLSDNETVIALDVKQPAPDSAILAGTLRYTEDARTPTKSYKQLIEDAKKQARSMGGNIVKVTDLEASNYYVLYISVYYRKNITNMDGTLAAVKDSVHRAKFGDGPATYAILYIYRPWCQGTLIGYDIQVANKVVYRASNNTYTALKVYQEGAMDIIGETESPSRVMINVKFGEEYYVKCSTKEGVLIAEPFIIVMPTWKGEGEYNQLKNDYPNNAK